MERLLRKLAFFHLALGQRRRSNGRQIKMKSPKNLIPGLPLQKMIRGQKGRIIAVAVGGQDKRPRVDVLLHDGHGRVERCVRWKCAFLKADGHVRFHHRHHPFVEASPPRSPWNIELPVDFGVRGLDQANDLKG